MPTGQEIAGAIGQFANVPQVAGDAKTIAAEFKSGWESLKYDARADARTEVDRLLPIAVLDAAYDLQGAWLDSSKESGFRFDIFSGQERSLIESIRTNHKTLQDALQANEDPSNPNSPTLLAVMYQKVDKMTLPLEEGLDIELRGTPGESLSVMIEIADKNGIQLLPEELRRIYDKVHTDRNQLKALLEADTQSGKKRKDEVVEAFEAAVKELSMPTESKPEPEARWDETNRVQSYMRAYMNEYDANNDARADANQDEVEQAGVDMAVATTGGILRMLGLGYLADLGISAAANFNVNVDISHLPDAANLLANNIINLAIDNPVKALALLWGTTLLSVGLSKISVKGSTDAIQMIKQRLKMHYTRREGKKRFDAFRQDYINRGIIPGRRSRKPREFAYTVGV